MVEHADQVVRELVLELLDAAAGLREREGRAAVGVACCCALDDGALRGADGHEAEEDGGEGEDGESLVGVLATQELVQAGQDLLHRGGEHGEHDHLDQHRCGAWAHRSNGLFGAESGVLDVVEELLGSLGGDDEGVAHCVEEDCEFHCRLECVVGAVVAGLQLWDGGPVELADGFEHLLLPAHLRIQEAVGGPVRFFISGDTVKPSIDVVRDCRAIHFGGLGYNWRTLRGELYRITAVVANLEDCALTEGGVLD